MRSSPMHWRFAPLAMLIALGSVGCRPAPEARGATGTRTTPGEVDLDPESGQLAYIKVEPAVTRRERVLATLPAQVVMDEDKTVRVLSPLAGRIRSLDAPLGAEVTAGAPLAHIASGDMAQATSDFYKARAAAVQSAAAYARAQDLYQHHVLALKDLEQARSDEETARAELARAQARLATLGASGGTVGSDYVLRAPIAGVVVDRTANPGAEVRPDNSTPLFTITSLDVVWLTANVYQHDLAAIRTGERLQFTTDAVPGRQFDATVTYVSSTLDPQTRTAQVRATVPNPGHLLRPQTFGTAQLVASTTGTAPVVPSKALVTVGNDKCVFVEVAPGHFRRRSVTVGDDDGAFAEITGGLSPGERVVTDGSILLLGVETQS